MLVVEALKAAKGQIFCQNGGQKYKIVNLRTIFHLEEWTGKNGCANETIPKLHFARQSCRSFKGRGGSILNIYQI